MQLIELFEHITIPVHLHKEERVLLEKLRNGTSLDKLTTRERDVIMYHLRIKGVVE